MKRILTILLFSLLLGACSLLPMAPTAEIPIAVPCTVPPIVVRPHLQISDLTETDGADVVIRAYVSTVVTLEGYASSLEILLNGYRK